MFSRENIGRSSQVNFAVYSAAMETRTTKEIGAIGETVAAEFLRRKGFTILERNYLKPWGEIDIIALKADVVRFVEVKAVSRESLPDVSTEINDHRPSGRSIPVVRLLWEQVDRVRFSAPRQKRACKSLCAVVAPSLVVEMIPIT
jgi:hypothetical protein